MTVPTELTKLAYRIDEAVTRFAVSWFPSFSIFLIAVKSSTGSISVTGR